MDAQHSEERLAPALTAPPQRIIHLSPEGAPSVIVRPLLKRSDIQAIYPAVASEPYKADLENPIDAQYDGMVIAEVLVRKATNSAARSGDPAQIEIIMDRLIGKPKSISENLNVSASYEDYLNSVAKKEETASQIIDVPLEPDFGDLE